MKTLRKYTFIFLIVLILLIVAFCTRSWSDSMSSRTGPYYGTIYTDDNFTTIAIDYERRFLAKWGIAAEVQRLARIYPGDGNMYTFSGILRYYLWDTGKWAGYGLFGGGVALVDFDASSDGDMLFNLLAGAGVERRWGAFALSTELRGTHQSNANTGDVNRGIDTWGFLVGGKWYFGEGGK